MVANASPAFAVLRVLSSVFLGFAKGTITLARNPILISPY